MTSDLANEIESLIKAVEDAREQLSHKEFIRLLTRATVRAYRPCLERLEDS